MAAGKYLQRHGVPEVTGKEADAIQTQIDREISALPKRRAKRRAA
jgi:hypothetical protein